MSQGHPAPGDGEGLTTAEYENTVDDLVRFEKYWYTHHSRWRYRLGSTLAVASGVLLAVLTAGPPRFAGRSLVAYVACPALLLVSWLVFFHILAPLIARTTTRRRAVDFLRRVGRRRISLDTDGVRETNDTTSGLYGWRAVHAVEADTDHVYIFLVGGTGWIVPRRAFPDTAASDAFLATARRLRAATAAPGIAGTTSGTCPRCPCSRGSRPGGP